MERSEIFATIRSFDHEGLDDAELERKTLGLLAGDFPDADAVHRHFLHRTPPIEEPDPLGPFDGGLPEEELERAENCLGNTFEFYGERHFVGDDIDWNRNPGNDHWVHDLNRFRYLDELRRATEATGDEKYVRKAAEIVLDWVDKCCVTDSWFWRRPEQTEWDMPNGVWRSYLNIAIHCQRWARHFERLVPFWSPGELLRVLKSIHDQLGYLEQIIPVASNNWIVIGSDGMLGTAARLPELRDRRRFIDYAWDRIAAESERQVLPDGVQFELTQGYHMCVLRLLLNSAAVSRAVGVPVPDGIDAVTAKMLDYTMQICTPDGRAVAFNDSDPGAGTAFRNVLASEGRRRGRDDWLYVGTDGDEGTPPDVLSQAFEHGGVYVMRTGWDRDATFLAFDGGPWGKSHQHDDRLSFQLSALGRPFIVDPGRYLYDANNPWSRRKYLNTTRAHSTVTVDGEDQADRFFGETWQPGPKLTDNTWTVTDELQRVAGSHKLGYGEDGRIRVEHRRSITFWPDVHVAGVLLVLDRLTGDGEHDVHSRLQFFPGDVVETAGTWHTTWDDGNLAVLPLMDAEFDAAVEKGLFEPTRGWYSEQVHEIESSPTLVVHARAPLPLRGAFLLVPYRGPDVPELQLAFDGDAVRLHAGDVSRTVAFAEALE
ncbi:MAG: alginate lyase family protein [Planctomycetota bacterium]